MTTRAIWRLGLWANVLLGVVLAALPAGGAPAADTAQVDKPDELVRSGNIPPDLTLRARVLEVAPAGRVQIDWRWGGEGLGGSVYRGVLGRGLALGEWSPSAPLAALTRGRTLKQRWWYVTFTVNDNASRRLRMEFEFSYRGKVIKTFQGAGPDGGTVGVVVPMHRLGAGQGPDHADFVAELTGLREYAQRRLDWMESLPWAKGPRPKELLIVSNLGGYGEGVGYGKRHGDRAIVEIEARVLRGLGVNGLRSGPAFVRELAHKGASWAAELNRGEISHASGYPVPAYRKDRRNNDPECGCPFGGKVARAKAEAIRSALAENLSIATPEVWALTVDEIGSVFDRSAEGKKHMEACPRCVEAFRSWAVRRGATPADFGQADWAAVKPVLAGGPKATTYYTRTFNNDASAGMFRELAAAFDTANAAKRESLKRGEKGGPATQPWVYSYALRGNTFLMGGHSLDFFDFYRQADNAFVYETSNRGWQIWQWDSYLCDVGRVVTRETGKPLGVYVKPHRGAPVQRALSAVARGARMLYWYTYGPDYHKGDSFSENPQALELTAKAAWLLGKSEDLWWNAAWAQAPRVAIVKPRCSEFLGNDAQWENAKWVYTALAHAHVSVDPIDEVMLATADLSRYRAIYVNGSHLPRKAAAAVERYVREGGVLWTSGWGCARDEADEPLTALQGVLGLEGRGEPELWYAVKRYGATAVQSFADAKSVLAPVPAGAKITGHGPCAGSFMPAVGREALKPAAGAEALAKFADGQVAMTVNRYGKGRAYTVGFYPGLEYSATIRDAAPAAGDAPPPAGPDMSRDFDAARRGFIAAPALAVAAPTVEPSVPAVEGVLLKNPAGKHAVVLMNWAYRHTGAADKGKAEIALVELKDVKILVRGAGGVRRATSARLDRELPVRREGDGATFTLPRLEEGDVVALE